MHLTLRMRRTALLSASILLAISSSVAAKPQSASPVAVRYCDLISNPDAYDGKEVRLRAEYRSGFEMSYFADAKCVKRWDPKKLVWVEFDDVAISQNDPDIVKRFQNVLYRPET